MLFEPNSFAQTCFSQRYVIHDYCVSDVLTWVRDGGCCIPGCTSPQASLPQSVSWCSVDLPLVYLTKQLVGPPESSTWYDVHKTYVWPWAKHCNVGYLGAGPQHGEVPPHHSQWHNQRFESGGGIFLKGAR